MKQAISIFIIFIFNVLNLKANDGVYFTSGSFLVPTQETCISVQKEVLTITIGRDSMALVDVYYEFFNPGEEKLLTMAFEASAPYNAMKYNKNGVHPFINDFTVEMNGQWLPYSNHLVETKTEGGMLYTNFLPINTNKWKGYGEAPDSVLYMDDALYNETTNSFMAFAYAYMFKARFKPGMNKVHHTYKYMMSYSVGTKFEVPYWLTPATRWANHQIDDFTLRIKSERNEFCMVDTVFTEAPFSITNGWGQKWQFTSTDDQHILLVSMGDEAVLEWHAKNFQPSSNIQITSAERYDYSNAREWGYTAGMVALSNKGEELGRYVGDCGDSLLVIAQEYCLYPKNQCRIIEYKAENGQGWLFISNDEGRTINIREGMSTGSKKLCTISDPPGCLPNGYRCLGLKSACNPKTGLYESWYKIKVKNKTGYVRADLVTWDAINAY